MSIVKVVYKKDDSIHSWSPSAVMIFDIVNKKSLINKKIVSEAIFLNVFGVFSNTPVCLHCVYRRLNPEEIEGWFLQEEGGSFLVQF